MHGVPRFQVGERVEVGQGVVGVIVRTEVLGDQRYGDGDEVRTWLSLDCVPAR